MSEPLPRAKKHFGQHFLHEPGVIARILRVVDPRPGQALVEIGPGRGALTVPLLQAAGRLRVIEVDRDVIPVLRGACGHAPGLEVLQADVLTVDFVALAAGARLRLVGNLPYNISTPVLFHVLAAAGAIQDMHFMLQKEVVDRICADPGTPEYGRLTVTVAARAEAMALFDVGPGAFTPAPRVDSAVVRIVPRPAPFPLASLAVFDEVVTRAFGQRRKTLANGLRGLLGASEIAAAGIDPQIRGEKLSAAEFARLANVAAERRQG